MDRTVSDTRQALLLIGVVLVGILATIAAIYQQASNAQDAADALFKRYATIVQSRLEAQAEQAVTRVETLAAFMDSRRAIDPQQLARFVASSHPDFADNSIIAILDFAAGGGLTAVELYRREDRSVYFKINENNILKDYLEVFSENKAGGEMIATTLPPDLGQALGIKAAYVVGSSYQTMNGEAGMLFRIESLDAFYRAVYADPSLSDLFLKLVDQSGASGEVRSTDWMAAPGIEDAVPDQLRVSESAFLLASLPLTLLTSARSGSFLPDYETAVITGIICLLVTLAGIWVVYNQSERASRISQIVDRRTRALSQAHSELENQNATLQNLNIDLEESRRAAEESNAAKSEFLATVSHELRTPLNAILGFSEIIKKEALGDLGDKRYRDYATDINDSGNHLLSLINDILDLAKLEAGKVKLESAALHPSDLLHKAESLMAQTASTKGLKLITEISPEMPEVVMGDELRLRQVLINLLSNAIKYTPTGAVNALIRREALAGGGDGWVIEVKDTGIGIPDDKVGTLFDRFTQVESSRIRRQGGAGLGLSICRELCDMMHGTISVESVEGQGSTFRVHLPLIVADDTTVDGDFI